MGWVEKIVEWTNNTGKALKFKIEVKKLSTWQETIRDWTEAVQHLGQDIKF